MVATRLYKISQRPSKEVTFYLEDDGRFLVGKYSLDIIKCHLCYWRMDMLEVKNKEEATEPPEARDGDGELKPRTGF